MTRRKFNPDMKKIFPALHRRWGSQGWWPARTRFEVITGAVLTQNTAWRNVERAISQLRKRKLLTVQALQKVSVEDLEKAIRSSGTFRVKARRLKAVTQFITREYRGSLNAMFRTDTAILRGQLLGISGIGPETADCILLYAGRKPVAVVDSYTRRMMTRHGWIRGDEPYDDLADLLQKAVAGPDQDSRVMIQQELHALIVMTGKRHCRARPLCQDCPLESLLPKGGPRP